MRVAVVSNITDGKGLARDYELLRDFLVERGHDVTGYQHDEPPKNLPKYDLGIFLEVIPRAYLGLAETKFWFPNIEWIKDGALGLAQKYFAKVFTKTREAQRILEPLIPDRTHYVGFLCRDQYDPSVPREPKFLHLGGNASLRGSRAVYDAFLWKRNGKALDAQLTIVSRTIKDVDPPPNVTLLEEVSEEELKRLQNSHVFHIYPSGTEGYGHAIHEAYSVGAQLITTKAPPMSEFPGAILLPAESTRKYNLATVYDVSAFVIHEAVSGIYSHKDLWKEHDSQRLAFHRLNAEFENAFEKHLEFTPKATAAAPVVVRKAEGRKTVAFLGNFRAVESTENMIWWALTQRLDMEVIQLQEDETDLKTLYDQVAFCDYFLWVRTPGWLKVSDDEMFHLLEWCRNEEIKTFAIHLDKFWGIPEREKLIGVHPFWKCAYVFTADGSPQNWESRGVNHFWMKPAVSEVYCHPGTPREEFRCDVMFCGAREYHSEYPFRAKMVDFLQDIYGDRFRHVTGVRGHALNDAYASAKVIVGDCFQAGTPYYWSDRVPETMGRHGLIVHPRIEGLTAPLLYYDPQDLHHLQSVVDAVLQFRNSAVNNARLCFGEYARTHDTWTVRLREIFEVVDASS